MSKLKMDQTNENHMFIIAGLCGMVEEDGLTPHEAFEVLEDIKRQTWSALSQIHRGEG